MNKKILIKAENLVRQFKVGDNVINAINGMSFDIYEGELTIILGPSGSGKTTTLNIIGGMDSPTTGNLYLEQRNIAKFSKKELTLYRRNDVGFVFQFYNLMSNLTALENVELSVEMCKDAFKPEEILTEVGLKDRMKNFPGQLSGGEQQRVSIARAVAKNPKILLCDEPTGALDYESGKMILKILQDMAHIHNKTVLIVTHNAALADMGDRVIKIKNGKVEENYLNEHPLDISEIEW